MKTVKPFKSVLIRLFYTSTFSLGERVELRPQVGSFFRYVNLNLKFAHRKFGNIFGL